MTTTERTGERANRGFLGHPAGLSPLFFTEFWERFSYYGMRAILLYYMYNSVRDGGLGMDEGLAASLMSIMFGHLCLAVPGGGKAALYGSMALIVLGTGLLKTNVSKVVGGLRDAAGFHAGFAVAAVGMALGIVWYLLGGRALGDAGWRPANPLGPVERGRALTRIGSGVALVAVLVAALAATGLLTIELVINAVSVLGVLLSVAYFAFMLRSPRTSAVERARIRAYIPLFVAAALFWMLLEQGSTILARFADQRTDLDALGFGIDPEWYQSIGAVAIVVLAPVFAQMWTRLGPRQPSTPRKFAAGLVFAGLAYLIMMLPGLLNGTGTPAHPLWLVAVFVVITLGELCVSPVGLSATTKLAPAALASQMMSIWFLADAVGQGISAQVVKLYDPGTETAYFGGLGAGVLLMGIVLFFLAPAVRRGMKGAE
ncbi:peptide MFS transporter [Streptomyces sp. TS71-3]|uniref:peptide MFS transporter n=1 Tax=Streptomyces sp. TS71-3 TaxID=2733862 RepID=UPI0020172F87|nr:oligopeptide:H+ symporter [Streptomyces sp. TS71-3]